MLMAFGIYLLNLFSFFGSLIYSTNIYGAFIMCQLFLWHVNMAHEATWFHERNMSWKSEDLHYSEILFLG